MDVTSPHDALTIRPARKTDARYMAALVNYAGEGMPYYFWEKSANGGDPWAIGEQRAMRENGSFSYRNALIAERGHQVLGMILYYPIADIASAEDYAQMSPILVPLQELEDMAVSTTYVNVLAVYPNHRSKGIGSRLLAYAAKTCGKMSIIVSDANIGAWQLYERHGFVVKAQRPIVKEDWDGDGENYVLLTK